MKKLLFALAAIAAAITVIGCPSPGPGVRPVNRAPLYAAINSAETLLEGTRVSPDGTDVPVDEYWVTRAVHNAFNAAIVIARIAYNDPIASQGEINAAAEALAGSRELFLRARALGSYIGPTLASVIAAAEALLDGTMVSSDGTDVPQGEYWVTQAVADDLEAAIATAQAVLDDPAATPEEIADAITALESAKGVFEYEMEEGSFVTAPNRPALGAAISSAEDLLTGLIIETDAANVPAGADWVTQAAYDAFNAAIAAAQSVHGNISAPYEVIASAIIALANAKTNFENAIGQGATVVLTALATAISEAEALRDGPTIAADATNVPEGVAWVTQAAYNALDAAIATAQYVYDNPPNTMTAVNTAIAALEYARGIFEGEIGQGAPVVLTALAAAIGEAQTQLAGPVIQTDATNVPEGVAWVTQAAYNALNTAITTAQGVYNNPPTTMAAVNAAVAALDTARANFADAIGQGTLPPSVLEIDFRNFQNLAPQIMVPATVNFAAGPSVVNITNTEGVDADSIRWLVGLNEVGTGTSLNLNSPAVHGHRIGPHFVTVEVRIGGMPYSRVVTFTAAP